MAPDLEEMADDAYRHNMKLVKALNYTGLFLIGAAAMDASYTFITGKPVVSDAVGAHSPMQEYLLVGLPLALVGGFLKRQGIGLERVMQKERVSK